MPAKEIKVSREHSEANTKRLNDEGYVSSAWLSKAGFHDKLAQLRELAKQDQLRAVHANVAYTFRWYFNWVDVRRLNASGALGEPVLDLELVHSALVAHQWKRPKIGNWTKSQQRRKAQIRVDGGRLQGSGDLEMLAEAHDLIKAALSPA